MKLYYLNGEKAGESWDLQPPGASLGRETDNDIQLLVGGVSRYHARIEGDGDFWHIRDLGSTNGTKVNGMKISDSSPLVRGDIVTIGDQVFRFGNPSDQPSDEAAALVQNREGQGEDGQQQSVRFNVPRPSAQTGNEGGFGVSFRAPGAGSSSSASSSSSSSSVETDTGGGTGKEMAPQPAVIFRVPGADAPEPAAPDPDKEKGTQKKIFSESFHVAASSSAASSTSDAGGTASASGSTSESGNAGSLFQQKPILGDIFGKSADKSKEKGESGSRKFVGNLLFYTVVIGLAVICISLFVLYHQEAEKKTDVPAAKKGADHFLLVYEKQSCTPDNIFYFSLTVENGSAVLSLDDLKHSRHFRKTIASVDENALSDLQSAVRSTDFMKLEPETPSASTDGNDEYRMITLGYDNMLNKISVHNSYAKSSFESVERAVENFVDFYGLKTVSLQVEEMRAEAEKAFDRAETLFENYEARPENLRNAILRYQMVIDFLDQFDPKPKTWDIARGRLAEAEKIMNRLIKDGEFNVQLYIQKKQYAEAVAECGKLMNIVDPDSKSYEKIRDLRIKLEKILMGNKS